MTVISRHATTIPLNCAWALTPSSYAQWSLLEDMHQVITTPPMWAPGKDTQIRQPAPNSDWPKADEADEPDLNSLDKVVPGAKGSAQPSQAGGS